MKDVSAIIVTHNSESEIQACIAALDACPQLIVVDNASVDDTVALIRRSRAEVLANPDNKGFAGAVNQGARIATGRYLLILNPDAVITTDSKDLTEACERAGLAAGCLTEADGKPQTGFTFRRLPSPSALVFESLGWNRLWPRNPINVQYRCLDQDYSAPRSVEQPAGAFLMIRRDVFQKLGGFDERFWPVWFEDVDFCRRAIDAGYKVEYVPSVRARHSGGHSVRRIERKYQRLYWYGSLLKYAAKHFRPLAFRTVCWSVAMGSAARLSAGMIFKPGGNARGEYSKVLQLSIASLLAGRYVCPAGELSVNELGGQRLGPHPVDGR